jgi:hypothetical protein
MAEVQAVKVVVTKQSAVVYHRAVVEVRLATQAMAEMAPMVSVAAVPLEAGALVAEEELDVKAQERAEA